MTSMKQKSRRDGPELGMLEVGREEPSMGSQPAPVRRKLKRQTLAVGEMLEGMTASSGVARKALKTLGLHGTDDGNATFLAILAADPKPTRVIQAFLAEAGKKDRSKQSVLKIAQDLGTSPAEIFLSYARGIQTLGQAIAVERVSEVLAEKMEAAVGSLVGEAIPRQLTCSICDGDGKMGRHKHLRCTTCEGSGKVMVLGENWEFAQKQIYKLAGLEQERSGIVVQQTTTNNVKGPSLVVGGGFMERIASLSDELVNKQVQIVDVTPMGGSEVLGVLPEADNPEVGEVGSASLSATGEKIPL